MPKRFGLGCFKALPIFGVEAVNFNESSNKTVDFINLVQINVVIRGYTQNSTPDQIPGLREENKNLLKIV